MEKLLLSREELDKIKSSQLFNQWLYGLIDENNLTEEEQKEIYAYQVYYDLTLGDDFIYAVLDRLRCFEIEDLLENENNIAVASIMYSVSKNDIKVQALLTKKRIEKEKEQKRLLKR